MIEIKIVFGAFLTIGVTGAVISITMGSLPGFMTFSAMAVGSGFAIFKIKGD